MAVLITFHVALALAFMFLADSHSDTWTDSFNQRLNTLKVMLDLIETSNDIISDQNSLLSYNASILCCANCHRAKRQQKKRDVTDIRMILALILRRLATVRPEVGQTYFPFNTQYYEISFDSCVVILSSSSCNNSCLSDITITQLNNRQLRVQQRVFQRVHQREHQREHQRVHQHQI